MILGIVAPVISVWKRLSMRGGLSLPSVMIWLLILPLFMIVRKLAVNVKRVYRAFTTQLAHVTEFLKDALLVVIICLSFLVHTPNVNPLWALNAAKKMSRMRRKYVWNQTTLYMLTVLTWIKWMSRDTSLCSWPWLWLCFFEGKWCDCGWFVLCFGFCALFLK